MNFFAGLFWLCFKLYGEISGLVGQKKIRCLLLLHLLNSYFGAMSS